MLAAAASLPAAPDVVGRVTGPSGTPIEGATVFVYTAAPKSGTSALCPSCYPDCGKQARSDATGTFKLAGLSSQLVFRLLVVASDYAPQFVPGIEPGQPSFAVSLTPRQNATASPAQTARGRVVDPAGAPIPGAVIEIAGAAFDGGRRRFGRLRGIDPLAVSDENGEFILTSSMPFAALIGRVSARAFANQSVQLAAGRSHTLRLTEGATLSGRVTLGGQPLPNVTLGLTPQNRAAGSFVGSFEVGTDETGRFTFLNLPPKTDYYVSGKMDTVGRHGALATRPVHVGRDGTVTDLGDLAVQPAHRLTGRVVLADRTKLPDQSRILIGRDQVSDLLPVDLGVDGEFDVPGIPSGIVTLSTRIPGYGMSSKNESYQAINHRLIGRIDADISGLIVLLEKSGLTEGSIMAASLPRPKPGDRPQDRPLRGIESTRE